MSRVGFQQDTCPFSYETCKKFATTCREQFERRGDASLNDCPIAIKWQDFRDGLFIPKNKRRTALKHEKTQKQKLQQFKKYLETRGAFSTETHRKLLEIREKFEELVT